MLQMYMGEHIQEIVR